MRMRMKRCAVALAAAAAGAPVGACSLDLQNPNAPTEEQVTTTPEGVVALATGLQGRFANSYFNFAYMAGLVTDEFASGSSALVSISDAEQGSVAPGTAIAENVFSSIYRTVRTAEDVLTGSDALAAQFEPGTRSGLRALALALKAEALGEALQSYQQIPIDINVAEPAYVSRSVALAHVRELLESAASEIAQTPPSAFFNASIMTPGANLPNIIHLFRARYARLANDHAASVAASNLVARSGPTALSVFTFPPPAVNFYANVTTGVNVIGPRRQYRTSMDAGDQRHVYFVTPATVTGRVGAPLDNWVRYSNTSAPIPVYYPDEALLIKAEALVNLGDLPQAQAVLDSVRTDCGGIDDPNACLAAYSGPQTAAALTADIYTQRRYELFATGLRWEDSRRRGITGPAPAPTLPAGAQRCWLPYAITDRNANPNVPADPAEPTTFPATCPVS